MDSVLKKLRELSDPEYAEFQAKLTPTIPRERFIGVRVPILRRYAKEFIRLPECDAFLNELPHGTYDEAMLHGLVLSAMKDYDACIRRVDEFLPHVDNWAVCDIMSPVVFKKHKPELIKKIRQWSSSKETYTCRFGLEMLQTHFLDADFNPEYLEIPASVLSEEYYVNMMIAWFFATALTKQWDSTLPYLTENRLGTWVHNKTIRKAIESNRIPAERKEYLRTLKR